VDTNNLFEIQSQQQQQQQQLQQQREKQGSNSEFVDNNRRSLKDLNKTAKEPSLLKPKETVVTDY